jgi:thioredoxin-related protein
MQKDWIALSAMFKDRDDVVIAELEAAKHKSLASKYGVRGFPTLKLFTKQDKSGDLGYKGRRNAKSMKKFVLSKISTH